jgi:hypothetical protein
MKAAIGKPVSVSSKDIGEDNEYDDLDAISEEGIWGMYDYEV